MKPIYQPVPDFTAVGLASTAPISSTTRNTNELYVVGYSRVDFWLQFDIAGGSPTNTVDIQIKGLYQPGISSLTINDTLQSEDGIAAGVYTPDPLTARFALAAGTQRLLLQSPTAGVTMLIRMVFNAADAASTYTVRAIRHP